MSFMTMTFILIDMLTAFYYAYRKDMYKELFWLALAMTLIIRG